jgi:hypothetical protein
VLRNTLALSRDYGTRQGARLSISLFTAFVACIALAAESDALKKGEVEGTSEYVTERVRGKVVWLDEALKRLYGITSEPDAEKTQVVLETADGHLWPLAQDTRGRSFVVDERLRDIEVELLVRRYKSAPFLQVIRVMRPTKDGLVDVDYWCDICAIPMYILKPCECCQGESRLRERPVEEMFDPAAK